MPIFIADRFTAGLKFWYLFIRIPRYILYSDITNNSDLFNNEEAWPMT